MTTKTIVDVTVLRSTDLAKVKWRNFSSVPYHCTMNNGRLTVRPQMETDGKMKGAVYTLDQMSSILSSSQNFVWRTFMHGSLFVGGSPASMLLRSTGYIMRCGPPRASVFYHIPLF